MNRNYFNGRGFLTLIVLVGSAVFSGNSYAYQSGEGICPQLPPNGTFCISAESGKKMLRAAWTFNMQPGPSTAQLSDGEFGIDQDQAVIIPEYGQTTLGQLRDLFGFWYRIGDFGPERPFATLKFTKQSDSTKSIVHLRADTTDELWGVPTGGGNNIVTRSSLNTTGHSVETEPQWQIICQAGSQDRNTYVPTQINNLEIPFHSNSPDYLVIPKWWVDRYPYFTDALNLSGDNNQCNLFKNYDQTWPGNAGDACPFSLVGVHENLDGKCLDTGFFIDLWYSLEIRDTGQVVMREQIKVSNAPKDLHLFRFGHISNGLTGCSVGFDPDNGKTACGRDLLGGGHDLLSFIPGTFKKGDLNGDGQINIDDVELFQNYVADRTPVSNFEIHGAGRFGAPNARNLIYYQGGDNNPSTLNDLFATKNFVLQESGGSIQSAVLWRWNFPDGNPVEIENVYLLTPNSAPTFDVRDLDGDGKLTVLDARKLVLLCTKPKCVH